MSIKAPSLLGRGRTLEFTTGESVDLLHLLQLNKTNLYLANINCLLQFNLDASYAKLLFLYVVNKSYPATYRQKTNGR